MGILKLNDVDYTASGQVDVSSLIDDLGIKSFSYNGDDSTPCNIQFPSTPHMILGIFAYVNDNVSYNMMMTPPNAVKAVTYSIYQYAQTPAPAMRCVNLSYDSVNNILTIDGANINFSLNIRNVKYTVYYI